LRWKLNVIPNHSERPEHIFGAPGFGATTGQTERWNIDSLILAFKLRVEYQITERVARSKHQWGIDATTEDAALAAIREGVRTFATGIILRGCVMRPLYDEYPSGPQYSSQCQLRVKLPYWRRSQVSQRVTAGFVMRRWYSRFGTDSSIESEFSILDEFERVTMIGELTARKSAQSSRCRSRVDWTCPPPIETLETLEREALQHDDWAALERNWDNFSTARGHRNAARRLRERVSCARHGPKLIP
jgi:hypothetical protein